MLWNTPVVSMISSGGGPTGEQGWGVLAGGMALLSGGGGGGGGGEGPPQDTWLPPGVENTRGR